MSVNLKDANLTHAITAWEGLEGKAFVANHIYDAGTMEWVPDEGGGGGGGASGQNNNGGYGADGVVIVKEYY